MEPLVYPRIGPTWRDCEFVYKPIEQIVQGWPVLAFGISGWGLIALGYTWNIPLRPMGEYCDRHGRHSYSSHFQPERDINPKKIITLPPDLHPFATMLNGFFKAYVKQKGGKLMAGPKGRLP